MVMRTSTPRGPGATYNAPITINPDAREVIAPIVEQNKSIDARLNELAEQIAREKGVEVAPLLAVLIKLGEKEVALENIPKRLDAAADELIKLRAETDLLRKGPAELARFADQVQQLIDKGEFDTARDILARGREVARARGLQPL
jgi:hypothetical protein